MNTKIINTVNDISSENPESASLLTSLHMKAYLDYLHTASAGTETEAPYPLEMMLRIRQELYRATRNYGEIPSIKEQLLSLNWSLRDVLVGTVRSQEQLAFCLKENRYYFPAKFMPAETDAQPRYVALHEEGLDGEACIRCYGKIMAFDQVQRSAIPVSMSRDNGEEAYVLVYVKEWRTLDNPIPIHDSYKGRPRYTNLFLLQHCNRSYQLFCIRSAEDYHTCATVIKAYNHRYETPNLHVLGDKLILRTEEDDFMVMNAHGRIIDRFPVSLYEAHPASVIFRIADLMK